MPSTTTQHTPGPYHVDHQYADVAMGGEWLEVTANHGAETVALIPALRRVGPDVSGGRFVSGAGLADNMPTARLIAAAPDMLEALQHVEAMLSARYPNDTFALADVRAAIAKATGGAQ